MIIVALLALVITILVETGIALLLVWVKVLGASARRLRVDVPLVNLATHPVASLLARNGWVEFWPIEAAVFIGEVLLYRCVTKLSWRDSIVLSLIANGATVLLALAARAPG